MPDDRRLQQIAEQAIASDGVASAAIFVLPAGESEVELAAAAGIEGPALEGLRAAVRDPAHPVARSLTDAGPTFNVTPTSVGGPALRSHLPLRPLASGGAAFGVLAVSHERFLSEAEQSDLRDLAAEAAAAVAAADEAD